MPSIGGTSFCAFLQSVYSSLEHHVSEQYLGKAVVALLESPHLSGEDKEFVDDVANHIELSIEEKITTLEEAFGEELHSVAYSAEAFTLPHSHNEVLIVMPALCAPFIAGAVFLAVNQVLYHWRKPKDDDESTAYHKNVKVDRFVLDPNREVITVYKGDSSITYNLGGDVCGGRLSDRPEKFLEDTRNASPDEATINMTPIHRSNEFEPNDRLFDEVVLPDPVPEVILPESVPVESGGGGGGSFGGVQHGIGPRRLLFLIPCDQKLLEGDVCGLIDGLAYDLDVEST